MKFRTITTFPNDLSEVSVKKQVITINKKSRERHLKKGIKLSLSNITVGLNGDDFVKNQYSTVMEYNSFKIPRFIGRHLLAHLK